MSGKICHDQTCNNINHFHPTVRCKNGNQCTRGYDCRFRHDNYSPDHPDFRRFYRPAEQNKKRLRTSQPSENKNDLTAVLLQLDQIGRELRYNTAELKRLTKKIKNLEKHPNQVEKIVG